MPRHPIRQSSNHADVKGKHHPVAMEGLQPMKAMSLRLM